MAEVDAKDNKALTLSARSKIADQMVILILRSREELTHTERLAVQQGYEGKFCHAGSHPAPFANAVRLRSVAEVVVRKIGFDSRRLSGKIWTCEVQGA